MAPLGTHERLPAAASGYIGGARAGAEQAFAAVAAPRCSARHPPGKN